MALVNKALVNLNEDTARMIALAHGLSTAEATRIGRSIAEAASRAEGGVLTAREYEVLRRKYFSGETEQQIAADLEPTIPGHPVTVERVRHVTAKAMRKLRDQPA